MAGPGNNMHFSLVFVCIDITYEKACSRASPFDRDIRHPVRPNPNSAMDEIMEVSESDSVNSVYISALSSYNNSQ